MIQVCVLCMDVWGGKLSKDCRDSKVFGPRLSRACTAKSFSGLSLYHFSNYANPSTNNFQPEMFWLASPFSWRHLSTFRRFFGKRIKIDNELYNISDTQIFDGEVCNPLCDIEKFHERIAKYDNQILNHYINKKII